jgi:hypothetical protein
MKPIYKPKTTYTNNSQEEMEQVKERIEPKIVTKSIQFIKVKPNYTQIYA